jgi:hypothetical protein
MTFWPFKVEPGADKYMRGRWRTLTSFDDVRIMQILELIQYSFLYFFVAFATGSVLDNLFPDYDEKTPWWRVLFEVLGQGMLLIVAAFYIRKLVKLVPFAFVLKGSNFKPYQTSEYHGDMMIGAIVFVAVQVNLLRKINRLGLLAYKELFDIEHNWTRRL